MTKIPKTETGGCRCGQTQFTVTSPILLTMACHCRGCQRMTGSAFSLSALYDGSCFEITSGTPVIGGMKAFPAHYVCPECSSWVFTKVPTPNGDLVNVRATMLNQPDHDPPFIETCTDEKLAWVQTGASHSFSAFPPSDKFGSLIGEFMERPK